MALLACAASALAGAQYQQPSLATYRAADGNVDLSPAQSLALPVPLPSRSQGIDAVGDDAQRPASSFGTDGTQASSLNVDDGGSSPAFAGESQFGAEQAAAPLAAGDRRPSVPALPPASHHGAVLAPTATPDSAAAGAKPSPGGSVTAPGNEAITPLSWSGQYFNNTTLSGTPALTRDDTAIDFTWSGAPAAGILADYFSVRWTQTLQFGNGGYQFVITHDNGGRLYIDGQLVLDHWWAAGSNIYIADEVMTSGKHTVKFEYMHLSGGARARLEISRLDGLPGVTATATAVPQITPTPTQAAPTATRTAAPVAPTATRTTAPVAPTATPTPTPAPVTGTRDKYAWPFAATSIWNMPIGSGAVYVPGGIQAANAWLGEITTDEEYIGLNPNDPLRSLNGGTLVHVPSGMSADGGWNGVAAFLTQDGHVAQGQPLVLTAGGNPSWQYGYPTVDLYADGIDGAHGGSGLSSFGGSIRKGELSSASPLRHALKVNLFAKRFLAYGGGACYRWPARHCDAYASPTTYGGGVSALRMGSLLALRPDVNVDALGLQSAQARKIAHAFQDYGAYVADDTFWDVHAIDIERGAEFGDGGTFHADLQRVFAMLNVVDNNGPTAIGGGGTPRVALAPAIGN